MVKECIIASSMDSKKKNQASMTMHRVSKNIKRLRQQKQMTLQEMADQCQMTKGYLSKIENSQKVPPYDTLAKIAQVLGVSLSSLVPEEEEILNPATVCMTPKSEYEAAFEEDFSSEAVVTSLADFKPHKNMMPSVWKLSSTITPMPPFKGEVLIYVLEGSVDMVIGEDRFSMGIGDHIYFDADIHHSALAMDPAGAKLLVVKYFYQKRGLF